jgi:hypothetical protein
MICLVGALIILGSLVGGYLLYTNTDRLDRQIRAELEEGRGR